MRTHLKNCHISYIFQYKLGIDISLVILYFVTIMNNNRLKLVLLGNGKQRFAVINKKKRVISVHLVCPFLRRNTND